jgi:mRNA interferase MazF
VAVEVTAHRRGEIWDVNLDPTVGSEIRKVRPCVIISPDTMNARWRTVIIAPLTTGGRPFPFRIPSEVGGRSGLVVLDQMKTVDKQRCLRKRGTLDADTFSSVLVALQEMFLP